MIATISIFDHDEIKAETLPGGTVLIHVGDATVSLHGDTRRRLVEALAEEETCER